MLPFTSFLFISESLSLNSFIFYFFHSLFYSLHSHIQPKEEEIPKEAANPGWEWGWGGDWGRGVGQQTTLVGAEDSEK